MPRFSLTVSALSFLSSVLMIVINPSAMAMQSGSNFDQAANSSVNYSNAVIDKPVLKCKHLIELGDLDNSVLSSELVPATEDSPEYCLLQGVITPEVQYVLYLPSRWNGRLVMEGNWGDAGEPLIDDISHKLRLKAMRHSFAIAFTNTGHDAHTEPSATWAFNNLQKEIDYGFRAVHVTALTVKQLINNYYNHPVSYSYFDGCSTGGREGLIEAQRFPADFDGILSGAPVMDLTRMLWQYWKNQMAIMRIPLTDKKLSLLADYVFAHFDDVDGVKDGVITNPLAVDFDPRRDLPRAKSGNKGFTDDEIEMLSAIYGPVMINGAEIFPRIVVGGEKPGLTYIPGTYETVKSLSAWHTRVVPDQNGLIDHRFIVDSWFKYLLLDTDDPQRNWQTLDPVRDFPRMTLSTKILDAVDPDLRAFHARGGKLILYHGWADFGVNPLRSMQYYRDVATLQGKDVTDFFRLYLIPGMQHCRGGTNVDRFDLMTPLIDWVEKLQLPENLVGKRVENGKVVRTRPLCPYPMVAVYKGKGSTDDYKNFQCVRRNN